MLINAIRGHCAEFGLLAAQGAGGARDLIARMEQADGSNLPMARSVIMLMAEQLHALVMQIQALDRRLLPQEVGASCSLD